MNSGRGGKRTGAGRPAKRGEPTATIWTRIKNSNYAWLLAESEQTGKDSGVILDDAIELLKSSSVEKSGLPESDSKALLAEMESKRAEFHKRMRSGLATVLDECVFLSWWDEALRRLGHPEMMSAGTPIEEEVAPKDPQVHYLVVGQEDRPAHTVIVEAEGLEDAAEIIQGINKNMKNPQIYRMDLRRGTMLRGYLRHVEIEVFVDPETGSVEQLIRRMFKAIQERMGQKAKRYIILEVVNWDIPQGLCLED